MATILVVDDDLPTRQLLSTLLGYESHRVTLAQDAREALELLDGEPPGLIIADVVMPGMDGYTFVRELRKRTRCKDVPVILMSATLYGQEARALAASCGAVSFIAKPFEPEDILDEIDAALSAAARLPASLAVSDDPGIGERQRALFSDALASKVAEVEVLNRDLESKVAERTRKLESANAALKEQANWGSAFEKLQRMRVRYRWMRWAVLACGLAFAAGSTYFFHAQVLEETRARFAIHAIGVSRDLESRFRAYEDVLYALRGLFDAAEQVRREDFHEFAEALALQKRYPGLTNIHFALRVSSGQKQGFERATRAEKSPLTQGLPEFSIKPPGERPEYLVLHYIEPPARSGAAWGLDLNADPRRRSAVQRARDTGQIAATSGYTLQSDAKSGMKSVLLRLAVYRGKGVPGTLEDRQRLYSGMVGATLRVGEIVEAALPRRTLAGVRVIIHEGDHATAGDGKPAPGMQLYDSEAGDGARAAAAYSAYTVTRHLTVGDFAWRLDLVPLADPVETFDQAMVAVVLAASLAVSALLFSLMSSLAVAQARDVELAQRNRSARLLGKLSEDLYSSRTGQEAYEVIVRHLQGLLPETAGALFVFNGSQSSWAAAVQWGRSSGIAENSAPEDCQSVRRQGLHSVPDSAKAQNCRHFKGAPPACYECVPLSAQGELIGVLHVQRSESSSRFSDVETDAVKAAAQHAGLALANLRLRAKLQEQATRDKLTGLYNRHYVQEWFEQELQRAARYQRHVGVIVVDIDHFKRINDSFGHEAGDTVLEALGALLKRCVRASEIACRYGGEEFLLVLREAPLEEIRKKAEAIRESIKRLDLKVMDLSLGKITASFGVAAYPDHAADAEGLLRAADEALYRAKNGGRDRVALARGAGLGPAWQRS